MALEGIMEDFSDFISHMSSLDDTWACILVWLCVQGLHALYFVVP